MENNNTSNTTNNNDVTKPGTKPIATATGTANTTTTTNNNHEREGANPSNDNIIPLTSDAESDGDDKTQSSLVEQPPSSTARTPFTNLSQVDSDLALARTLQEQERAYMMLRNRGSDYGSWEGGSFRHNDDDEYDDLDDDSGADGYEGTEADEDEDAFDANAHGDDAQEDIEIDPSSYSSDEAYARALQEAEERDMAARLFALSNISGETRHIEGDYEDEEDIGDSQDDWDEVDPDELSYEELIALGEVVGTESRGLSADVIASLPSVNYKTGSSENGSNDSCVICRLDYEDDDTLTLLSCKHSYHTDCINNWLKINKVCPVCSAEVSGPGQS